MSGRGDDGSVILALLLTLTIEAVLLTLSVSVSSGTVATRAHERFLIEGQAADAGIQQALLTANSGQPMPTRQAPRTDLAGDGKISWWAEAAPPAGTWLVHSTGSARGGSRTQTATLVPSQTGGTSVPTAPARTAGRFGQAVFADTTATFRGSNTVDSYDSRTGATGTGHGAVATNGTAVLRGNATADEVILDNYAAAPDPGRCDADICPARLSSVAAPVDTKSAAANQFVADALAACAATGRPAKAWIASRDGASLTATPGGLCFTSMLFDTDTAIVATAAQPALVYVSGNVNIANGVTVNATGTAPASGLLQVFTQGTRVSIGNQTHVGAALWAPNATCAGNPSNAQAQIYGSMVCDTLSNQGGWQIHYDDALPGGTAPAGSGTPLGSGGAVTVWTVGKYGEQ